MIIIEHVEDIVEELTEEEFEDLYEDLTEEEIDDIIEGAAKLGWRYSTKSVGGTTKRKRFFTCPKGKKKVTPKAGSRPKCVNKQVRLKDFLKKKKATKLRLRSIKRAGVGSVNRANKKRLKSLTIRKGHSL